MPPAVVAAGAGLAGSIIAGKSSNPNISGLGGSILQAGTGLAGSLLASRGQSKAAEASERSAAEALAFEREREERRRLEYDRAEADRKAQFEANERRLAPYRQASASVLAKYGIEIPLEEEEPPPDVSAFGAAPPEGPPMNLGSLGARRPYGY